MCHISVVTFAQGHTEIATEESEIQARKRIAEKLKRARQRLRWSVEDHQWVAEFVTKAEVDADAEWKDWCFDLTLKEFREFPKLVTKVEAFATWSNQHYRWNSCTHRWNNHPPSGLEPRSVDEESKKLIKAFHTS